MARQTVTDHGQVAGWFERDKATEYPEGTAWDEANTISLATGTAWDSEALWRTAQGRWVLHEWARRDGDTETWRYIDDEQARDWLLRNAYPDAEVDAALGVGLAEEVGPGRPEIGPQVKVRLPAEVLAAVDAAAQAAGVSRSAWIRDCVTGVLGRV